MTTSSLSFSLRLPAGLLRIWHPGLGGAEGGGWNAVARKLEERLTSLPGIHRLGMGLYAAVPQPGDGDGVHASAACGRRFGTALEARAALEAPLAQLAARGRLAVRDAEHAAAFERYRN